MTMPLGPVGPVQRDEKGRIRILPDVIYLFLNSVGRAAAGATVKEGLGEEWRGTLQSYVDRNGKFTKFETLYLPISLPPLFWEYNCGQCFAFQRETQTCKWVKEEGFPNPGIIHPQGWCTVWMPLEGATPFSYIGKIPWFLREKPPAFP